MNKCYSILLILSFLFSCTKSSRNTLDFSSDFDEVSRAIFQVDDLYHKLNDTVKVLVIEDDKLTINQKSYMNFKTLQKEDIPEFNRLTYDEWNSLMGNIKILTNNQINGFSTTNYGFTRFIYKKLKSSESYENRYIAIDKGDLQLGKRGYKLLDAREKLVLFTYK
jgi:hypothetical protein